MRNSPVVMLERLLEKVTPDFDEVTVFLISFTFTTLFVIDANMRADTIRGLVNPFSMLMFFFLLLAKILAWYHAFSRAKKSHFEKNVLLIFGLIMPIGIGFEAFNHIIMNYYGISLLFVIFPLLNMLYASLLLFLYRTTSIIHSFDPRNAEKSEVFFGMALILVLVVLGEFVFHKHWSIVYSMGIVYATFLGKVPYMVWNSMRKKAKNTRISA